MPETAPPEVAPPETPPPVEVRRADFPELDPRAGASAGTPLDALRDVPITLTARLGQTTLPIGAILRLGPGAVVELEQGISAPVELTVRGVPFATGEVVVIDDHFAIRIKTLLPARTVKATEVV